MRPRILIVEDEEALAEMLRYNLEAAGFEVTHEADGLAGLASIEETHPDLAILDWMVPGLAGIDICRRLRADRALRSIPVIMLTARGEEADRLAGLEGGADDYMVKPFSPKELVSRIKAVLRRTRPAIVEDRLEYAGLVVDLVTHRVTQNGQPVHLGPTEFRLLCTLMERPGRVFSREALLDLVWGRNIHVEDRTVDVHIRRLRQALTQGGAKDPIRTVRGAGYALDEGA